MKRISRNGNEVLWVTYRLPPGVDYWTKLSGISVIRLCPSLKRNLDWKSPEVWVFVWWESQFTVESRSPDFVSVDLVLKTFLQDMSNDGFEVIVISTTQLSFNQICKTGKIFTGSLNCRHIIFHKNILFEVLKVPFAVIEQLSTWRTGMMSNWKVLDEQYRFLWRSFFLFQSKRREAWPLAQTLRVVGRGLMLSMLYGNELFREKALRIQKKKNFR